MAVAVLRIQNPETLAWNDVDTYDCMVSSSFPQEAVAFGNGQVISLQSSPEVSIRAKVEARQLKLAAARGLVGGPYNIEIDFGQGAESFPDMYISEYGLSMTKELTVANVSLTSRTPSLIIPASSELDRRDVYGEAAECWFLAGEEDVSH